MTFGKSRNRVVPVFIWSWLLVAAAAVGAENTAISLRILVVATREEAVLILAHLNQGADFAALAREKSTDSTAADGGYMGKLEPALLRVELRDALQGIRPGQLSQVIKLPSGYAILQVLAEEASNNDQNRAAKNAAEKANDPNQFLPLAGRGSVRYSPNIAGAPEADAALQAFPKFAGWEQDLRAICTARQQSLAQTVERLHTLLMPASSSITPGDPAQIAYVLGELEAYQGHMDEVIQPWEEAYQSGLANQQGAALQLEEALGVAYLHKSEMENGVYTAPGERCDFPPRQSVAYQKPAGSENAIRYFTKYLEKKPDDLEVKWLLNVAYMTLGKYPAGVPAKDLIPPSVFASKENVGRFEDVATAAGIDLVSMAGGIIVDDFDNDGLLDIVISSYNMCEHMHFFHNNGDGTFSDRTKEAGLLDELGGLNMIQADFNNDGCMDILVTRGGWQLPMRMSLLRNNCNGTFTDVTREAGLSEAVSSQSAVWADIDNDGFVDLFVRMNAAHCIFSETRAMGHLKIFRRRRAWMPEVLLRP